MLVCFCFYCLGNCGSGLTNSNYTELNQLYEKYKDQGLQFELSHCLSMLIILTIIISILKKFIIEVKRILFYFILFIRNKISLNHIRKLNKGG